MDTRSAAHRPRHRRRRRSRPALLVGLVVALLGTVPVLVPFVITRDSANPVTTPPGRAAESGMLALPRTQSAAKPIAESAREASRGPERSLTTVGSVAPPALEPPVPLAPATSGPAAAARATAGPPSAGPTSTAPPSTSPPTTAQPTPLSAAPDLVIVAVSWSPEQPAAGQLVTFTAVVRNDGAAATPKVTHRVGFVVDGGQVSRSSADSTPLAPGEQRTYAAERGPAGRTWTAVAGGHELQVWIDDPDRISETDEGNNTMTVTLTVP